ncbi:MULTISPECIES: GNAT family N-acetyltransferase [Francisella]|uniref:GNAT family N-acetyltransferase n=1 Tax=Francisella adeliensis TaxID=2007306 RepID=A0A2Z4Y014_9GAMM|nr:MULTISPECIES: GNAT family N-acetyltransferase [Francisella]AXA34299.1 GNAT family N-acetyltransferase [Francisella adeliensis]MBK2084943.1 GNAT family N-acetyltransferase [Francisella adeliensis]MBK2096226.1 GNAT family N-acetyltransferase [Francisella adeliensis]QIW12545.1 GNAT family N-acetyltransferase [Francisella adeliensis]QIW14418.1 GNAT family N-acetyltransferase [Francisella adeliensis]
MDIRKATPQDHEKMKYVWSECILTTCYFLTTREIKKLEKEFEEKFLKDPNINYFTQWLGDEFVGFACIRGKDILFTPINPVYFGKRYGEQMVAYILENYEIERTYVYCSDMHSLAFYSNLGFEIEDRIPDIFFGNPYEINQLRLGVSQEEALRLVKSKILS